MSIRDNKPKRRSLPGRDPALKIDLRQIVRFEIIAGVIVAVILVLVNLIMQGNVATSQLAKMETIRIGVRTDVQGFGEISGSGAIQGFDADVATEVVSRVFGKDKLIKLVQLSSEDAGAQIKYGTADIGIGFLAQGTERAQGFLLTGSYYKDDVCLVVSDPNAVKSAADLNGKNVGILNSMITQAQANTYLKNLNVTAQVTRYYGYEQAMIDLDTHKIYAFMAPRALLKQYMSKYPQLGQPVAQVGYSIILSSTQGAVQGAMNTAIRAMQSDGTIGNLAAKWGLSYKK